MSPSRPPGWYTDSADPSRERWWDGGEWSHVTRPGPERPAPRDVRGARPVPGPPGHYGGPGRYGYQGPHGPPGQHYGVPPGQQYGPPPGQQHGQYGQYGPGPWTPAPFAGPTTPDGVPLGDPGPRLLARLLDYVITTIASSLLGLPLLLPFAGELQRRLDAAVASGSRVDVMTLVNDLFSDGDLQSRLVWFQVISLVVSAVYTVTMVRYKGATVGKLAVGVRVRPWAVEGRPTWTQSLARWVTREGVQNIPVVGPMYWVLDSFWLLWDPRRQALHDKVPHTVVVRAR